MTHRVENDKVKEHILKIRFIRIFALCSFCFLGEKVPFEEINEKINSINQHNINNCHFVKTNIQKHNY